MSSVITEEKTNHSEGRRPFVIAIGGGKGGIGKSFVSTNLALALSRTHKVCIVDLDLGASNVHTCLGIKNVSSTMSDFISKKKTLEDIKIISPYKNLTSVSGFHDHLEIAQILKQDVNRISEDISKLSDDVVILDLGAGTSFATVHFFLSADLSLAVTSPDPTSVENAYRFLKTAFYQKICSIKTASGVKKIISEIMSHRDQFGIKSPAELTRQVKIESPICGKILEQELQNYNLGLILNQTRSRREDNLGSGMSRVIRQYFGTKCNFYGALPYDDTVWQSVRKCQPILHLQPYSSISQQIQKIAQNLVGSQDKSAVV